MQHRPAIISYLPDVYRCWKLVYLDVQLDETDLAGGQKLFSQESLPDIHILLTDIFCGNKNLHRT